MTAASSPTETLCVLVNCIWKHEHIWKNKGMRLCMAYHTSWPISASERYCSAGDWHRFSRRLPWVCLPTQLSPLTYTICRNEKEEEERSHLVMLIEPFGSSGLQILFPPMESKWMPNGAQDTKGKLTSAHKFVLLEMGRTAEQSNFSEPCT